MYISHLYIFLKPPSRGSCLGHAAGLSHRNCYSEEPRLSVVKKFLIFLYLASKGLPLAALEEVTQCFVLVNCPFDQL